MGRLTLFLYEGQLLLQFLIVRFAQAAVVILVVSVITFGIIYSAPGGPEVLLAPDVDAATVEQFTERYGLNDPLPLQYMRWLGNALRGDFGVSFTYRRPVLEIFLSRFPATLVLSFSSLVLAVLLAIPLGVISAVRRYTAVDYVVTVVSLIGVSIPVFWFGILCIILFTVIWPVLPAGGMYTVGAPFSIDDRLRYLILPCVVLGLTNMAEIARYTRSSMVSVLDEDFVRTARAKGIRERAVINAHALRNAMLPVVTVIGLLLPRLIGGTAITESVFAWPGIGRLAVDAALQRDYPIVMAVTLAVSVGVVVSTLVTDLVYALLDPRIRYS